MKAGMFQRSSARLLAGVQLGRQAVNLAVELTVESTLLLLAAPVKMWWAARPAAHDGWRLGP